MLILPHNLTLIFPVHPRTAKIIAALGISHPHLHMIEPMGYLEFNYLVERCKAVLSDSGTISEESSIMNFPALNIREAHESPKAMGEASVMMVGLNPERILQGLVQLQYQKTGMQPQQINEPYGAEERFSQIFAEKKSNPRRSARKKSA